LPVAPLWTFYPQYAAEIAAKIVRWASLYIRLRRIYLRIKTSPDRYSYTDLAMTPVGDNEFGTHELFNTGAAQAYVAQAKRIKDAQDGHAHAHDGVPVEPAE
jgi:hypothetical protein